MRLSKALDEARAAVTKLREAGPMTGEASDIAKEIELGLEGISIAEDTGDCAPDCGLLCGLYEAMKDDSAKPTVVVKAPPAKVMGSGVDKLDAMMRR